MALEVHTRLHSNCAELAHELCAQNCTASAQIVLTKLHKMGQEVNTRSARTRLHGKWAKFAHKLAQDLYKHCPQDCTAICASFAHKIAQELYEMCTPRTERSFKRALHPSGCTSNRDGWTVRATTTRTTRRHSPQLARTKNSKVPPCTPQIDTTHPR